MKKESQVSHDIAPYLGEPYVLTEIHKGMADNVALISGLFALAAATSAIGAVSHALSSQPEAPLFAGATIIIAGLFGGAAYFWRKIFLIVSGKAGLLEYYSDALKDLEYDVREKITEYKRESDFAKEDAALRKEQSKNHRKQRLEAIENEDKKIREARQKEREL